VTPVDETRRRSAALFNNEKMAEVILSLHAEHGAAHAQEISRRTSISHSLVRDVLVRLAAAGVLTALPKLGGSRGAQYYEPSDRELWQRLVEVAGHLDDRFQGVWWRVVSGDTRRVSKIGAATHRRACRPSWTPIWTPSRPHCT